MIPLIQVSTDPGVVERDEADLDRTLDGTTNAEAIVESLIYLVSETASGVFVPRLFSRGVTEFQLTRGLLGLSM